jgi:hypothetical protein
VEWGTFYDVEKSIPSEYFQSDEELIDQIRNCPSGALSFRYNNAMTNENERVNENEQAGGKKERNDSVS